MPMMMDDDLDELFGDAPPLQIPSPLPEGLFQCVDDLRLGGCCQYGTPETCVLQRLLQFRCRKIAWSKLGCIAYVAKDGRAVNLRHLVCNSKDGRWNLSEENLADEASVVLSEHDIVHLSWNHTGNDLAFVDVYGQISIFTIVIALNRLTVSRRCIIDPEDNLGAVVGYLWLNTEREVLSRVPVTSMMLTW